MKRIRSISILLVVAVMGIISVTGVAAQAQRTQQLNAAPRADTAAPSAGSIISTTFTYQGLIKQSGSPINGSCDLSFRLFDAASTGAQIGSATTRTLSITNGLFTASLNFGDGSVFAAEARWLDIRVRCPAGSGGFTTLNPRQALTPAPLALALPGLRTEPNATSPNIIGGHSNNTVTVPSFGSVIGGGGSAGSPNSIDGSHSTIVGGSRNKIVGSDDSFIGGGFSNTVTVAAHEGTIGGGGNNLVDGDHGAIFAGIGNQVQADDSFIGGGDTNTITVSAAYSVIGGGQHNQATQSFSVVGGGRGNKASSDFATVSGGDFNTASGGLATVSGGSSNTASGIGAMVSGGSDNSASGWDATIPGGQFNSATMSYTLAAGYHAKANHPGTFVWADSTNADFASTANDQFLIRAKGFVGINDNHPTADLTISSTSTSFTGIDIYNSTSAAGLVGYRMQVVGSGVAGRIGNFELLDNQYLMVIQPGGNVGLGGITTPSNILTLPNNADTSGRGLANAWNTYSSRRWKTNINTIPNALDEIQQLRGVTFDWKSNGTHDIGLVAEEVGQVLPEVVTYESNGVDAQSVDYSRLVAVLIEGVKEQQSEIKTQQQRIDQLQAQVALKQSDASPAPFNVFNLISVIALIGFVAMWSQQRKHLGGH